MTEKIKLLPSEAALRVAIRSALGVNADIYEDQLVKAIVDISPSSPKVDMVPRADLELVQLKLDCMLKVVEAYEHVGK